MIFFRSQSFRLGACNAVYSKLDVPLGERNNAIESNALIHDKSEAFPRFYELSWSSSTGRRSFSSDAGAKTAGEEDELETRNSDEEFSGDEGDIEGAELESLVPDSEAGKIVVGMRSSELFKAIVSVSGVAVGSALDKWVEEGKEINRTEFTNAMLQLRKRRMYGRALQVYNFFCFNMICILLSINLLRIKETSLVLSNAFCLVSRL